MNKKISVLMPNGTKLVAEENADVEYKEIFISIEDAEGCWLQDLAIVGEKYCYKNGEKRTINGQYSIKVYANENIEDYTHSFDIKQYEGEV